MNALLSRRLIRLRQNLGGEVAIFIAFLGAGVTIGFAIQDATYDDAHSIHGLLILTSRFSALIGTYLVLISLIMIARVPWIERSVGFDKLVTYHRKMGPVALWLITTHLVLIVIGYARADSKGIVEEFATLINSYSWMIPALVAFILMVLLGVSSVNSIRRNLRYEIWWNVHLVSYFAVALAFMHQILTGSLFLFNEVARIWWIGLYVYTAFTLLMWRFLLPIARSFKHKLIVDHVIDEGAQVSTVYISGRNLDRIHARGGSFFEWRFLTRELWSQAHPYSLSAPPTERMFRITVKNLGDHSAALAQLKPGVRVVAEGPYGIFNADRAFGKKIVLIGGGVGITPLRAIMQEFDEDAQIDLIYRVLAEDELVLKDEIESLVYGRNIKVHYLVGAPADFPMAPKDLVALVPHLAECDVFLCGPPGLARIVRHSVEAIGVPSAKFHHEAFAFGAR
jgi:predicted ferric reductase